MFECARRLSYLAGVVAFVFCACTPLNAPTDAALDTTSGSDRANEASTVDAMTEQHGEATPDSATSDGPADTKADALADTAAPDAPADTGTQDAPVDTKADAPADTTAPDAPADTKADAPADTTAPDAPADAKADASADAKADAPSDTGASDAHADGPSDAASGGCGRFTRGPAMVPARTPTRMICIDATEVTQAQYQQFLDDKNGDTSGQNPECQWNVKYAPDLMCVFDPTGHPAYPVNGLDWCDATAFCKWAGKRLCGGPTGGLIETSDKADLSLAEVSEWTAACSHSGDRAYPYGTMFDGEACNAGEHSGTPRAIVPVGTTPGCQGGYPGIVDLVGNVHEWEDACHPVSGTPGRTDKCWFAGGSYHDLDTSCTSAWDVSRDYVDYLCDIGFRCCADP